jgi:hypothetical protein
MGVPRMTIQLFVHGGYYKTVPASAVAPLRVLCEETAPSVRFASFVPVPGTANTIWECTDPGIAVRDGRLVAAAEGGR